MEQDMKCPICGSEEIGVGKLDGYTMMKPYDKFFTTGSAIKAYICTSCGHILSMRVTNPEKFKK